MILLKSQNLNTTTKASSSIQGDYTGVQKLSKTTENIQHGSEDSNGLQGKSSI